MRLLTTHLRPTGPDGPDGVNTEDAAITLSPPADWPWRPRRSEHWGCGYYPLTSGRLALTAQTEWALRMRLLTTHLRPTGPHGPDGVSTEDAAINHSPPADWPWRPRRSEHWGCGYYPLTSGRLALTAQTEWALRMRLLTTHLRPTRPDGPDGVSTEDAAINHSPPADWPWRPRRSEHWGCGQTWRAATGSHSWRRSAATSPSQTTPLTCSSCLQQGVVASR